MVFRHLALFALVLCLAAPPAEAAIKVVVEGASVDGLSNQQARIAKELFQKGEKLSEQGKYQAAVDYLVAAIQVADEAEFRTVLGMNLINLDKHQQAEAQLDQAIAMNRKDPNVYNLMGFALARAKTVKTNDPRVRYMLHNKALRAFDQAISLRPSFDNAYYGKATVYLEMAQYDKALAAIDKAIQLNPERDWNKELKARIVKAKAAHK